MLTIACVLRLSKDYDIAYVHELHEAIETHVHEPYDFVCLTDAPIRTNRIKLEHDWPGWWAKMEVFKLPGPVLYIDLDTMPVADLTEITGQAFKNRFTVLRDFYNQTRIATGLMAWNGDMSSLYENFARDPEKYIRGKQLGRGDQWPVEDNTVACHFWQDVVPGQVVSFKADCLPKGEVPKGARIVCFHGRPRPRDIQWNLGCLSELKGRAPTTRILSGA